ncbi:hypothetical protein AcW1_008385 [Taiwanofungus camphoratus]|nr:hypothetical protein AcW1_008385 [Antrodia cinnamomea]
MLSYLVSLSNILIFAGDILAKSSHAGSLAVLDFITHQRSGSHSSPTASDPEHKAPIGSHDEIDSEARTGHRDSSGCRGRVYAVRGNHDQMVIQWCAWRDWFEKLKEPLSSPSSLTAGPVFSPAGVDKDPPIYTGTQFLALVESEWEHDRARDPKGTSDPIQWADVARKRAAGTWRAEWWRRIPRPGKRRARKDWQIFSDHYWLAKDMTPAHKECLRSLPLVLHIPSEHVFVVHAGILPSDPHFPPSDMRQPLAHSPYLKSYPNDDFAHNVRSHLTDEVDEDRRVMFSLNELGRGQEVLYYPGRRNRTEERLRTAQEKAILSEIPDNRDPWVLLNMRGVRKKGKVTRSNDKGTPWSQIWNDQIGRCAGFDETSASVSENLHRSSHTSKVLSDVNIERSDRRHRTAVSVSDGLGHENQDEDSEQARLPCEPSTIVYGHAATRGLDVKRWSIGLDTGCLYGRRLTALVLKRSGMDDDEPLDGEEEGNQEDEEDEDDDDRDHVFQNPSRLAYIAAPARPLQVSEKERRQKKRKTWKKRIQFGDDGAGLAAQLVSVKCPKGADYE